MKDHGHEKQGISISPQMWWPYVRALGAVIGVVVMVTGVAYAARIFNWIMDTLRAPDHFQPVLGGWVKALGGEQLDMVLENGARIPVATLLAVVILGVGATLLIRISLGLITAGAKTLSCMLGDREAIKRILTHVFGPGRKAGPVHPPSLPGK